jgi:hypothetical protein
MTKWNDSSQIECDFRYIHADGETEIANRSRISEPRMCNREEIARLRAGRTRQCRESSIKIVKRLNWLHFLVGCYLMGVR